MFRTMRSDNDDDKNQMLTLDENERTKLLLTMMTE